MDEKASGAIIQHTSWGLKYKYQKDIKNTAGQMIRRVMLCDPRQGGDVIFRERREGNRSPPRKILGHPARPLNPVGAISGGKKRDYRFDSWGFLFAIWRRNCGDTGEFRSVLKQFAPSVLKIFVIVSNKSPCKFVCRRHVSQGRCYDEKSPHVDSPKRGK